MAYDPEKCYKHHIRLDKIGNNIHGFEPTDSSLIIQARLSSSHHQLNGLKDSIDQALNQGFSWFHAASTKLNYIYIKCEDWIESPEILRTRAITRALNKLTNEEKELLGLKWVVP